MIFKINACGAHSTALQDCVSSGELSLDIKEKVWNIQDDEIEDASVLEQDPLVFSVEPNEKN